MKKLIELIKYAFWGGISTVINLVILFTFITFTEVHYIVANSIAYFFAVIVNYICNKLFVFKTKKNVKNELSSFLIMRLISLGIDNSCYYVLVDILQFNVYLSRVVLSVFIIAITYIINKIVIFKEGEI